MSEERKSRYELFLEEEEKPQTKRCTKCGKEKTLEEFCKDKRRTDGIRLCCKACRRAKNPRKFKNPEDRFWKYFNARVKIGECTEWVGGYINGSPTCHWDGKTTAMVRRVVYSLTWGDLPDDMFIKTTCDNSRCVRLSHLKKVTFEEMDINRRNNKMAHGSRHGRYTKPHRTARGEKHGSAKLNTEKVREIRARFTQGESKRSIARALGVGRTTVEHIIRGETWAHVQ